VFQINFLPELTQVNFIEFAIALVPAFAQLFPALGAAADTPFTVEPIRSVVAIMKMAALRSFNMCKLSLICPKIGITEPS
jgi:hypothetical protein